MVDAREVMDDACTFFCGECEQRYGTRVEVRWKLGDPGLSRVKRFWKRHEECGAEDLDDRINSYIPNLDDKIVFCKRLYAENPSIKFAEVQRLWAEQKKGIDT